MVRATIPAMPRPRHSAAWSAPGFLKQKSKMLCYWFSSVAKRGEVDLGATFVRLPFAVRRIVEEDGRALDEAVVEGLLQIDLLVFQIGIERRHHVERAAHPLAG